MSWAKYHIEKLLAGETVCFRPRGQSMRPYITSGQLVTVRPRESNEIPELNSIVLSRVRGADYLHFVRGIRDAQVLIGNAHGHENGWTQLERVYGVVVRVQD